MTEFAVLVKGLKKKKRVCILKNINYIEKMGNYIIKVNIRFWSVFTVSQQ